MEPKIGDRVRVLPSYLHCGAMTAGILPNATGTLIEYGLVRFDTPIHGHGKGGRNWHLNPEYLQLIETEMAKTKRTFTNSQKIRLRLKVYFDSNDTGYDDFEEFYTAFTDAMLDNIEFLATMFLK